MKYIPGQDLISVIFQFSTSVCPLLSIVLLMFNFSDRQLSDTLANFLYLCQPRPCPSNWPEHWQSPINPPPYKHNLFCSLVLKHERKQKSRICLGIPMFTTWVKNSLLGSRKIKFITWVNPSSEYSLLGSEQIYMVFLK